MIAVSNLANWPALRWPWAFLAVIALSFEAIALFFQYKMSLEPCIMCVYQRVAMLGIVLAALPALLRPELLISRLVSFIGWLTASAWGLKLAVEHVKMQNPENFMLLMSCDVFPNFPNWMPLHHWLPSIFEPRGTCGDIDWMFLGLSMPEWMIVIFTSFLISAISFLAIRLVKKQAI